MREPKLWTSALAVESCPFALHEWWATHRTGKHKQFLSGSVVTFSTQLCNPTNHSRMVWNGFSGLWFLFGLNLFCAPQVGPKGKVIGIDHIKELVDDSINNVKKDDPNLITSGRVKLIGETWWTTDTFWIHFVMLQLESFLLLLLFTDAGWICSTESLQL